MIEASEPQSSEHAPSGRTLDVHCVIGTRPDAIKMAPVIHQLAKAGDLVPHVICTGQHRELLEELLPLLGLCPHCSLDLMVPSQTVAHTVGRVLYRLGEYWQERKPRLVLVQGDTGTAVGAALAAYYERIPIGHVEAGLRTFVMTQPFPEEMNRILISRVASLHFCPTDLNRQNLLAEGVSNASVFVTGNTGVDSFLRFWRRANGAGNGGSTSGNHRRMILVTSHRRENVDGRLVGICRALAILARNHPTIRFVFPVHPNPAVKAMARQLLGQCCNIELVAPMVYDRFVDLMSKATLVLTDSGGIQEEACTIGKPALVIREATERQEGSIHGSVRLIGTDPQTIVSEVERLLEAESSASRLYEPNACFGDGRAASRIVAAIRHAFFEYPRPPDYVPRDSTETVSQQAGAIVGGLRGSHQAL